MKKILIILSVLALCACKNNEKTEKSTPDEENSPEVAMNQVEGFESLGEKIDKKNMLSASEMKAEFENMKLGDTISVKFKSEVDKVCKKKGCWMTLKLDDSIRSFVKFKDYSFFMPLDSENREAIVKGKAYLSETPVDELKHFAKDAGKSEEEIAAITEPKIEYAFMAEGVLMETPEEK
ncbi:DUF4920 domain-containing protein [Mesonia aquimarina]|uniref:DUF4920 domain-containing protein n=1 Tax=Mesonia aquimarina TaxID=1504967 RepID=UPI000EF5EE45|nr:DUF4920 domain-containing protein [Mesonia aquimarina]